MTPELPPLPSLPIYGRDDQEDLCALVGAVEARERILLARIAELEGYVEGYQGIVGRMEADAARYVPVATLDEGLGRFYWLSEKGHHHFPMVYMKRDNHEMQSM